MPKIDIGAVPKIKGVGYPPPLNAPCAERTRQRLGNAGGLSDFGVNLMHLPPGGWSSQRHWHSHEDEFVWVLEGQLVLVTNAGEEVLGAGDCAAFKRGDPDGHHLINRSTQPAKVLEIGNSDPNDRCVYSDIDMIAEPGDPGYQHRDGTPYPAKG